MSYDDLEHYEELINDVNNSGEEMIDLLNKLSRKLDKKYSDGIIVNMVRLTQYVSAKMIFALSLHYGRTPNEEFAIYNESMEEALKMFQLNKETLN